MGKQLPLGEGCFSASPQKEARRATLVLLLLTAFSDLLPNIEPSLGSMGQTGQDCGWTGTLDVEPCNLPAHGTWTN